jgi:class 3 adenylate cyclase/tetratricopeptide (TPR) repeat protein
VQDKPMSERSVERRAVTALFVDVVGSTRLTVELGPERLKRTLDHAFAELAARIGAAGGTVEKYVGDAIHAIFGAPTAHPDDAQRALRAAHACVRWAEGRSAAPVPFSVRVGVETGEAIVDLTAAVSDRQQMSVGACVNVAARLQQAAEPGEVLVGPACHETTAETAEFAPLGEIDLKGLGPTAVWRLVQPTPSRAADRVPFVGRDTDLDLLRLAYRRARSGRAVLALVSGPPGQGKTRLVEEFVRGLEGEVEVVAARCRPAGELGARSPLHQLLGPDGVETTASALGERLARLFSDSSERHRVLAALAHSAGLTTSPDLAALPSGQRYDEIANGWRRYLAALAQSRPVAVWIDDLHWADAELIQLLDRLTLGGEARVLVIGTARPEMAAQARLRPGGDRFFITLDALDDVTARALARSAGAAEPAGVERAEGNPLFIIELARARSLAAGRDVPLTLQGVIGARLDELPPPDRELLQRAAVAGDTFTIEDAATLATRDPGDVADTLWRLTELRYVHPVAGGVRFHHALLRDVAYGRLTATERMRLHAQYARDRVAPDDVEALAHHLWEAVGPTDADWVWEGSDEAGELRDRAREAHLAAARRSADRFACERAAETCRRAFRFARGPLGTAGVEQALGDVYRVSGDADAAWAHYLRAREILREAGVDPPPALYPSLLEIPIYTSGMFRQPPEPALVEELASEGEAVARRAGDAGARARLCALGAYRRHDPTGLVEALQLSEQAADVSAFGSFLTHAAILEIRAGEFDVARQIYERLDAAAAAGDQLDRELEFRAILALSTGRVPEAERLAEQFMTASASRGPHLRTHAYREQGHVLLARGDWQGLVELAVQTERLVADHPHTAFCYAVTSALAFATVAHAVEGRLPEARALLVRALAPLQSEPLERESVLLLASAAAGARDEVEGLLRKVYGNTGPMFWFFQRAEAVAHTMLERWEPLEVLLPQLGVPARGSAHLAALVAALREERAAARGGPPPAHRDLRQLGYLGWSRLLRHRPPPA